ncbi:MAG: ABC transporter ATP-binding protein [Nitrospirae bacterium]|nr:ABC transporter ATP-binding protein [Nitrospirota bacterium]MBF0535528.1 ABC transporter ATP-binding protein [Nitrospirota bacterium]MBF0617445.1 ABC transporter ATP-binding protein [Nitrospirota bacterium]
MPHCELKMIEKTYCVGEITVEALRGVNLIIEKGDFTAITGVSGSGKTTLLNIIGCLDVPTSGSYKLNGTDVSHYNDDALSAIRNKLIGFVFQHFYLLPYITAIENVLLPVLYTETPVDNPRELALDALTRVGLSDRADFKPGQLSGGQQQRVAIARALINSPSLIICDEPTGQLDSKTASEVMQTLVDLNTAGKTILMVTHDAAVARIARRAYHIRDGLISNNDSL